MKRQLLSLAFLAQLALASALHAKPADDRAAALAYLEKTRDAILRATEDLTEAQWNFKPAPDRWSVVETLEHIASAESQILDHIKEKVMSGPAPSGDKDPAETDAFILQAVPDRSEKFQAPEPLIPTNRFESPAATLQAFEDRRADTIAFVKQTDDLRQHSAEHFFGFPLDAHQWVLFLAAHAERHTRQIEEILAHPDFPQES